LEAKNLAEATSCSLKKEWFHFCNICSLGFMYITIKNIVVFL